MYDKVVVGLCTKDEEESIRQTIHSIHSQKRSPEHVIVCDDSEDNTTSIIRDELKSSDTSFEIFQQTQYSGHGGARKELYERVKEVGADIFCVIDANIEIDPNWLKNILEFWEKHPKYDVLTGPHCSRTVHYECTSPHDPLYYRHATMALDTSLVDRIDGWDADFNRGEDWDFALRMYRSGAKVFTSSRWCSTYVNSDPIGLSKERIARNPTSIPYLSKYGAWYAKFHPLQLIKDGGSIGFYGLLSFLPITAIFLPQYLLLTVLSLLTYLIVYVLSSVYAESEFCVKSVLRALFRVWYTAPAVLKSVNKILQGSYR